MFTKRLAFLFDSSLDRVFALCRCVVVSKPSTEVHAGRLLAPLEALVFSVADVLKDLDPLVNNNISKHGSSKWSEQCRNCEFIASLLTVFPEEIAKNATLYFAVACKSNIKANKNVIAQLSHVKNKRNMHSLRQCTAYITAMLGGGYGAARC